VFAEDCAAVGAFALEAFEALDAGKLLSGTEADDVPALPPVLLPGVLGAALPDALVETFTAPVGRPPLAPIVPLLVAHPCTEARAATVHNDAQIVAHKSVILRVRRPKPEPPLVSMAEIVPSECSRSKAL
jgi:hypothetical protein